MPYFSSAWNLPSGDLIGHACTPAHCLQRAEHLVLGDRVELQHVLGFRRRAGEREQQMLGRDELVLHAVGFGLGRIEHFRKLRRDARRRPAARLAANASAPPRRSVSSCATFAPIFSSTGRTMPPSSSQQRRQQMHRLNLRIPRLRRQLLRAGDGLLGLDRQFVESEWHEISSQSYS